MTCFFCNKREPAVPESESIESAINLSMLLSAFVDWHLVLSSNFCCDFEPTLRISRTSNSILSPGSIQPNVSVNKIICSLNLL